MPLVTARSIDASDFGGGFNACRVDKQAGRLLILLVARW